MLSRSVLGFHCSHEQHAPSALLRFAALAAEAGFSAAMCSDHFHPWSERNGHSGFAWAWLGAALHATRLSFGTVCAPVQRYHPAVIAQAAATLSEMFPDRFWLAIGSGEALNESITGRVWPSKETRNARVLESARIMRALWAGETVTSDGSVQTHGARLFSRPARPPLLLGAALTPKTAHWVGSWADGLITVAGPRDRMRAVVDAFREGAAGAAKPMFLQVALSFAPTDAEAARLAYDCWRHCALSTDQLADLPSPAAFDDAVAAVDAREVSLRVRASSDIERHADWLRADLEMGFARLYLHNVAWRHQERFIAACGEHLIPRIDSEAAAQRAQ
jgi:coenzyme F420-dependent glucose-6-phosphate dehydrogenase